MIETTNTAQTDGEPIVVSPINRLRGELRLPGDKSISHRAAMLGALARGESTFKNFSTAQDCEATLDCLRALGVGIVRDASTVTVDTTGATGLKQPEEILNARNSGTTMRLLAGLLAGQPFTTSITGDDSLLRRPMLRVAEPLRLMGARVELEANGSAPLRIKGRRPLQPIHYELPVASAQIKSAMLLAGLAAEGVTTIVEPTQTRDHTERVLPEFGVPVERAGNVLSIHGGIELHSCNLHIPGDISSAAFFIAAAVALPGSDLLIRDVGLNPTRTAFLSSLKAMGAEISVADARLEGGEPVGSLHIHGCELKGPRMLTISGAVVSSLIDELPLLAFLAASVGCGMNLRDASELRFKESDRISGTVQNLTRMGAQIQENADGWLLHGGHKLLRKLHGARLSSFGDHRIAMACAVAALAAEGLSQIEGARSAVAVSLPEFWTLLESLVE